MRDPLDAMAQVRLGFLAANLLDPRSWIRKANDLRDAAGLLRPELDHRWARTRQDPAGAQRGGNRPLGLNGVWLMLKAFEIENLGKARLVKSLSDAERKQVDTTGVLPRRLHSHVLPELFRQTELLLTDEETAQLKRLEEAAVTFGRYPLPARADDLLSPEAPVRQKYDANDVVDADSEITSVIVKRLRDSEKT